MAKTTWEYHVETTEYLASNRGETLTESVQKMLNRIGGDGWELVAPWNVGVESGFETFIFKRPVAQ